MKFSDMKMILYALKKWNHKSVLSAMSGISADKHYRRNLCARSVGKGIIYSRTVVALFYSFTSFSLFFTLLFVIAYFAYLFMYICIYFFTTCLFVLFSSFFIFISIYCSFRLKVIICSRFP